VYDKHLFAEIRKYLPFQGSVEKRFNLARFVAEIAMDSCVDVTDKNFICVERVE